MKGKHRIIDKYSFEILEEILGLQHDSIRMIEVDKHNEILLIMHSDIENGAEEIYPGCHTPHKNKG